VLPTLLATLGAVFVDTGVGKAVAALVGYVIPTESWLACLLAFGLGMVAFTAIMGNAFAAFPVMMGGDRHAAADQPPRASPAALGAMGMADRLLRYAADADGGELQTSCRRSSSSCETATA